MGATPNYSDASLRCRASIPSTMLDNSLNAGWTSVFVSRNRDLPSQEAFETLATPDQTIVVMTCGEQDVEAFHGGMWRRAVYRAGTVGMTAGGQTDRLRRRSRFKTAPVEKVSLYVPQSFFQEAAEHYRRAGQRDSDAQLSALAYNDPLIAHGVLALLQAMVAGAPDLYAQVTMQWLATHLLSAHCGWRTVEESGRRPDVISDPRLARVIEYMSAHFEEAMTLEKLSSEAGISKFHFIRVFRASMGLTPHVFLVQLRMKAARAMLASTDLSVSIVARRCGFAHPVHFGTAFAKRFGQSPSAFRAQLRV